MAKSSLRTRLTKRQAVRFDRVLIESLERDEVAELVADFLTNVENTKSLGYQFIAALESLYGKPVVVMDTDRKNYVQDVMVQHILDVITDKSQIRDDILQVGGRRQRGSYYIYRLVELEEKEAEPRDPFSPSCISCQEGFAVNYDVELYGEDGMPKVNLDVQTTIALAWTSGEFPDKALQPLVAQAVTKGIQKPDDLRTYIPEAVRLYHQIRRQRTGAQERLDNLLKVKEAGRDPEPFRDNPRARRTF